MNHPRTDQLRNNQISYRDSSSEAPYFCFCQRASKPATSSKASQTTATPNGAPVSVGPAVLRQYRGHVTGVPDVGEHATNAACSARKKLTLKNDSPTSIRTCGSVRLLIDASRYDALCGVTWRSESLSECIDSWTIRCTALRNSEFVARAVQFLTHARCDG
ncbi:hypothetical protein MRX96_054821 [Rhipicephalus microplus]